MGPLSDEPEGKKGRWPLWAALLCLAGLAGGAAVRFMTTSRGLGAEQTAAPAAPLFQARLSTDTAPLWARLIDALGRRHGGGVGIKRLITLLEEHKHEPLARSFAADFEREPQLIELWDRYSRSQDALDAAGLALELEKAPAFTLLLDRYSQNPDFVRLVGSLTGEVKDASEEGAGPGAARAVETAAEVAAQAPKASPLPGVRLEAFPTGQPVAAGGAPPAPGPADAVKSAAAVPEVGRQKKVEQFLADVRDLTRMGAKPNARMLAKVKSLETAGSPTDQVSRLASLFETMPPRERSKLIDLCLNKSVCEPVAACNQANLYASCVKSCNDNPDCAGQVPPAPAEAPPEEPAPGPGTPQVAQPPAPPPSSECPHGRHRHLHRHHDGSRGDDRHCIGVNHHR